MNATSRPTLLSFGIVLSALWASFVLVLVALGAIVGLGAGGVAALSANAEAMLPLGFAFGIGALVISGMALYYFAVLLACLRAWQGSRGWTIALIVFSMLGLLNAGPVSVVVGVMTIVGCAQALSIASPTTSTTA